MASKLKLQSGVLSGESLQEVFQFCKENECALPAVNVIGSHGISAAMFAAKEAKSPIIIQFSNGGAHFAAGKFLKNDDEKAAIAGAVSAGHFIRVLSKYYEVPVILHTDHAAKKLLPWVQGLIDYSEKFKEKHRAPLYSSHMLDLSEEPLEENLDICKRILTRMKPLGMLLEMELGVTGGEEDGVDNTGVDNSKLYTQPSEVLAAYDALQPAGQFTIAASFGNTHGVYKPGNVILTPKILRNSQELIEKERNTDKKPVNFVFHGGSGSSAEEIREAVSYGVIKMNIDTDTQWAFTKPIKNYMDEKSDYLKSQIGNPEGEDKPNKKYIDPRQWVHLGEKEMANRLIQAFKDLNSYQKFDF
ncbi:MAG: class II fructose-bisphosphate aldolase [Spirochaetia bacterium]|nr:class II fructose-bisphosphate aldolase [Spirochaetia bacterium]